ncbi:MAG: hypothetical protein U0Q03_15410 [Acidimicrobiales bacterium]
MAPRPFARILGRSAGALLCVAATVLPGAAAYADDLPEPVPVPSLPPIEDPGAESARLVPVPSGCQAPAVEQTVFIGKLLIADAVTGRYQVEQVLSGSVEGFSVQEMIDVRYGDEVRFLHVGQRYIVGAGIDPAFGVLASTVRAPAPLFGGNEVAGVDDGDVDCPSIGTPIRTVLLDGTSVETGVLTPLKDAEKKILRAVLVPVGVAFLVLFGLVVVKHLLFALGRSLRDLSVTERPSRRERRKAALERLEQAG